MQQFAVAGAACRAADSPENREAWDYQVIPRRAQLGGDQPEPGKGWFVGSCNRPALGSCRQSTGSPVVCRIILFFMEILEALE